MTDQGTLLLVGCGKMGSALLGGFLAGGLPASAVTVVEPTGGEALRRNFHVTVVDSLQALPASFQPDMVLFAVKPQSLPALLPDYAKWGNGPALMVSIAAGTAIATFEQHLGKETPVIRLMPNLPALVGAGITGAFANRHSSAAQKAYLSHLMASVGEIVWLADESLMDAVTAISGSGPAYIFHFIEALTAAGRALGLPDKIAEKLAYHTLYGSAKMAMESDRSAGELRVQVTSPNGTTAAALEVLMEKDAFSRLIKKAVDAAQKRSVELSQ